MAKSGATDYNVDEPNANWDEDQMRVYHMRRLERQITQHRNNRGQQRQQRQSHYEEDEDEALERQLAMIKEQNAKEFITQLENHYYVKDDNRLEFS